MRTLKNLYIVILLSGVIVINSCVQENEFDIPNIVISEPQIDGDIVSMQSVINAWADAVLGGSESFTFEETNTFIEGYVISSDKGGNFFEELIIQNATENATAGLRIAIDVNPLFTKYEIGRKVYIKLDGLSVALDGGVISLGILSNNEIEKIPLPLETEFILRSATVSEIIPRQVGLNEINASLVNTLVSLPSTQFTASQVGLSFANEIGEQFDAERTIESCGADGGSITLETSTFSDFKGVQIPGGSGQITAVLSRDFFGENNVLVVRELDDITFDNTDRCEPSFLDPNITPTTTFRAIKARFEQEGGYEEFGLDEAPLIIEGYVVSSDQSGNFFEELFIQSTPSNTDPSTDNPRLGLRITVDQGDLYQQFQVGRKIYVILNGLAIDEENGVLTIGFPNVSQLEKIPSGVASLFLIPGETQETIVPKVVAISDITPEDQSTFIQFSNVQINRDFLGLTYAGEPTDNFDGARNLESCDSNSTIELQTSTFASFKSVVVNENKGSIQGILTRDFNDSKNVFVINDLSDIMFTDPERCDPVTLDCGLASAEGSNVLFEDDFETQTPNSLVTGNGWTNYIEAGSLGWEAYTASGTNASLGVSARMGAFGSGEDSNISWLITPPVDLNANPGAVLSFQTSNSFSDDSTLELLFSNDWDGTEAGIANATWGIVPQAYIVQDSDFFGNWFDSGFVDLSCGEGSSVYFAFRYNGSDTNNDFNGTYELDNIRITSN